MARSLAERANFTVIRSDVVRKLLAGLDPTDSARGEADAGIYTPEWTERTYAECLRLAKESLFEGNRVLVDASFGKEEHRRMFLEAGSRWDVPVLMLLCQASPDETVRRLRHRRGDASDADASAYESALKRWEPLGPDVRTVCREIQTDGSPDAALACALEAIRERKLF